MKIICIENNIGANSANDTWLTVRTDSSVLRNNDDFYLPHFSKDIVCAAGVAVRINRIVKCVEPRFASRSYDEVLGCVSFVARDVMTQAIADGRPCDEAYCFDHSFAVSPESLLPSEVNNETEICLTADDCALQTATLSQMLFSLDECVSRASQLVTLRVGDIVFAGFATYVVPQQGQWMRLTMAGRQLLSFKIK